MLFKVTMCEKIKNNKITAPFYFILYSRPDLYHMDCT